MPWSLGGAGGGLSDLGIRLSDLVAGFGGGVVNALFFQHTKPAAALASVLGGAITANFLASSVQNITRDMLQPGVAGFVVGLTAMVICQGVFAIVDKRIKKYRDNNNGI